MAYQNPSAPGINFLKGSAVINAGSTYVTVSLPITLPSTNYVVLVTPASSLSSVWFVSNKTTTSFNINLVSAPSVNVTFDYFVVY